MPRHLPPLLAASFDVAGSRTIQAPFDRAELATADVVGWPAADAALDAARALFEDRDQWLPPARRVEILRRLEARMAARRDDLAMQAAREGGKPLADSKVETDRAIEGVRLCAEAITRGAGEVVPMNVTPSSSGRVAFTVHEPRGVVVAVSAFNHPLNLIVHQVGPAVAAGCPVIVKPAEDTPISCWNFVELLREAGLPEGWCQALLTDGHETTERLVTDGRVAFFSFIGSAKVGWMLRSRLAPGTRCALEHGGVAPAIVLADADLDDAVPRLVKGGFYHAGQVCVSVQRVLVERSIAEDLAGRLAEAAKALVVGDPADESTDVGPIIRPAERQRIDEWIEAAVDGGARMLCGGEPVGESCYAPTVLLDPPGDALVSREEVFGPVVCVESCDGLDDAIRRASGGPYAFQSAIFTKDLDAATRAARRLDAAAVMINDHTAFRVDWMPFAGLRHSGLGVGGIEHTMRDMQVEKLVVLRSAEL